MAPHAPTIPHKPTHKQNDRLTGKCVYFARVNPKGITEKTWDADMAAGDIVGPSALDAFRALVSDVYLPLLQVRGASSLLLVLVLCMRVQAKPWPRMAV